MEDPERSLTPRGEEETRKISKAAKRQGVCPKKIYHSGKKRAEQTAEIIAEQAGVGFIGRNCCLITPGLGSWTVLAGVAVTLAVLTPAFLLGVWGRTPPLKPIGYSGEGRKNVIGWVITACKIYGNAV